jgi:hypothetical protein
MLDNSPAPIAFVVMCFDGRLHHVYHRVVKPVLENHGFHCKRGDEILESGMIVEQIQTAINGASLILCDLTFDNPNVFYELGIAHVQKKPIIMISQNPANAPFDIRHWRIIPYEDSKLGLLDLREALVEYLNKTFPSDQEPYKHRPMTDFPVAIDELEIQRTGVFSASLEFKRYAIKFLGDHRDKASFQRIEMIAVSDSNPDVIRDAFSSLYKIDPDEARPLLLESGLHRQKEYLVRERVVALLGNYPPDEGLLGVMREQLGDTSWGVRRTVCEVLGRWGKSEAVGPLQKMLSDPEPQVRLAAAEALERLHEAKRDKE